MDYMVKLHVFVKDFTGKHRYYMEENAGDCQHM